MGRITIRLRCSNRGWLIMKRMIAYIRVGLLATWIVLAFVLLLLVQYAKVNVAVQSFVTALVWVYIISTFIVTGILGWLKKKNL